MYIHEKSLITLKITLTKIRLSGTKTESKQWRAYVHMYVRMFVHVQLYSKTHAFDCFTDHVTYRHADSDALQSV